MSLKEYNEKRDFTKTAEPAGEIKSGDKSERIFAVQKHAASRLHFDFRLEWEGVLLSWAVPKGPSYNTKDKRLAVEVELHPYDYKDFEGTIPKGEYGGGTVMLWDEGTWEAQEGEDFEKGLKSGSLKIILHGERLKGKWALIRMKPREGEEDKNWLLIKEKDEYTQSSDGISEFITGVRSGKTMEEIAAEEEMETYDVQLATLQNKLPKGDNWIYELKYDGYRILAYVDNGSVKLETRNHQDYSDKFPDIVKELEKWKVRAVVDGEMIINVDGRSNFQALQKYIKTKKGTKPVFMVFDLLYLDGEDIRSESLADRRKKLNALLEENKGKGIHFSDGATENGDVLFKAACENKMEGIIAKRSDRSYTPGRNRDWLKIKCQNRQEFTIIGYTQTDSRTRAFSALLLGVKDKDNFIYAGRVGTGFSESSAKEIMKEMKPLERKTPPIDDAPKARYKEEVTWLTPKLIVEVNFAEWTDEGLLRQASFLGLREDKESKEVVRESEPNKTKPKTKKESTNEEVKLTSPDKKMFKEYTKEDLYNYYDKVSERMLPYVKRRLVSLFRCPEGISKDCFYQKHLSDDLTGLYKEMIEESDGDKSDYIYLEDKTGILQAVQYGTIEFHAWGSSIDDLEKPDMIVFDLDPDEGMGLEQVREGVLDLKSILDELDLKSFLKTSGGKGYHVVVPLVPKATWDEVRDFSKNVATFMEKKWPKKYTSNMRKEKRKGKIYVDWVRNGRGATSVTPYSVRAREPGSVSWPISWSDLGKIAPNEFTIETALKSRKKDPWTEFFKTKQSIG